MSFHFFVSFKGRDLAPGAKVKVYRNLHKEGVTFSVRDAKTGLVLGHTQSILLSNVTFEVNAAGRAKVLRDKKKNVHAFVTGNYTGPFYAGDREFFSDDTRTLVTYNPYKAPTFVRKDNGEPVFTANLTLVDSNGVFAS